jgi:hypothetical protein
MTSSYVDDTRTLKLILSGFHKCIAASQVNKSVWINSKNELITFQTDLN